MKSRKLICYILLVFLIVGLLPILSIPALADTSGDWQYRVENGEVTLLKYIGSSNNIVIPSQIEGNKVVYIGEYMQNPNSVISGSNVTSITISNGVGFIADYAFSYLTSLCNVIIPDTVWSIGHFAFRGDTSLTEITIPASIVTIGRWAFEGCSNLHTVYFKQTDANVIQYFGDVYPPFANTASDFKIVYPATSAGFTTPTWNGYPAYPDIPVPSPVVIEAPTADDVFNNSIIMKINSITALVNGQQKILRNILADGTQDGCYYPTNQNPQAYNTTLVPLRFISENLGGTVRWNNSDYDIDVKLGNTTVNIGVGKTPAAFYLGV